MTHPGSLLQHYFQLSHISPQSLIKFKRFAIASCYFITKKARPLLLNKIKRYEMHFRNYDEMQIVSSKAIKITAIKLKENVSKR